MLRKFESFLGSVKLKEYRDEYRCLKIVEMDLPKEIQAIRLLYDVYWNKKKFISFKKFYKIYLKEYSQDLEEFRKKIQMCKMCFYKGLPARIYRTWASLITQIHAGYVAQSVFGKRTVSMSEELDHNGADFRVEYKGRALNYQVKKKSFSREVRQDKQHKKKLDGRFITIMYDVPKEDCFENPKRKDGKYRKPYLDFKKNKNLKRLDNGFVVFTSCLFKKTKLQRSK